MIRNHTQNIVETFLIENHLILGTFLMGVVSLMLIISRTPLGSRWATRSVKYIQRKLPDSEEATRNQLIIDALATLEKEGDIRKGERGFKEIVDHLIDNPFPTGEHLQSGDEILKLERVRKGYKGVEADDRGVPKGIARHIHAVMVDNSRKIAGIVSEERNRKQSIKRDETKRKIRVENIIETFFITILAIIFTIGLILSILDI